MSISTERSNILAFVCRLADVWRSCLYVSLRWHEHVVKIFLSSNFTKHEIFQHEIAHRI